LKNYVPKKTPNSPKLGLHHEKAFEKITLFPIEKEGL
jgi:hypothetical protein